MLGESWSSYHYIKLKAINLKVFDTPIFASKCDRIKVFVGQVDYSLAKNNDCLIINNKSQTTSECFRLCNPIRC